MGTSLNLVKGKEGKKETGSLRQREMGNFGTRIAGTAKIRLGMVPDGRKSRSKRGNNRRNQRKVDPPGVTPLSCHGRRTIVGVVWNRGTSLGTVLLSGTRSSRLRLVTPLNNSALQLFLPPTTDTALGSDTGRASARRILGTVDVRKNSWGGVQP